MRLRVGRRLRERHLRDAAGGIERQARQPGRVGIGAVVVGDGDAKAVRGTGRVDCSARRDPLASVTTVALMPALAALILSRMPASVFSEAPIGIVMSAKTRSSA